MALWTCTVGEEEEEEEGHLQLLHHRGVEVLGEEGVVHPQEGTSHPRVRDILGSATPGEALQGSAGP